MKYFLLYQKEIGLALGGILGLLCFMANPMDLPYQANQVLAIAILMIIWWIFEAMPMPVVAMLPIILFPSLGITTLKEVTKCYGDPIIFLFMGGFIIALAIEKWNLHVRMALGIIRITGTNGDSIILGFILATGFLSLWLSNTATTMMMFPIAISVIEIVKEHNQHVKGIQNFSLVLMLSIAYASNFALGTVIATPPNVAYVGFVKDRFNHTIGFDDWMILFMPLTIILLFALYWILVKVMYPNHIKKSDEATMAIKNAQLDLGRMSTPEWRVFIIFCITVVLWIVKDLINACQSYVVLDDTIIAMLGGISLFLIPSGNRAEDNKERLMTWPDAQKMAWDVLLLFGGGIALANALEASKLVHVLGADLASIATDNLFLIILIVTTISVFLSEVISNLALVIILAPVLTSLALALKIDPLLLGIPMTLGASCACMLPMGTPPNAIVFAKGHIKIQDMMKAGFVLNLVCILLITIFCTYFLPMIGGIKL